LKRNTTAPEAGWASGSSSCQISCGKASKNSSGTYHDLSGDRY
jgi:hypothetical protein